MNRAGLKNKCFLFNIGILILIGGVSIFFLNRAFIIGSTVGLTFIVFSYKKIKINKHKAIVIFLLLIVLIGALALCLKRDSTLGRIFIYKISAKMFLDHPITGIGYKGFQKYYGLYQAEYFQLGKFNLKEFLLADNTFYAFNDYWEIIVETGLMGALFLIFFICLLVKLSIKRLKNEKNNDILKLFIALVLVMCVAAGFTHVFEYRVFKISLFFFIIYILLSGNTVFRKSTPLVLTLFFSLILFQFEIKNRSNYKELEEAKILLSTGYILESQGIFEKLYPHLKKDIDFLKTYNDALRSGSEQEKKISVLKEILARYTDNMSYLKLAKLYEEAGMNKDAETAYLKAVYMVPNRFLPKEALFSFYLRKKQYEKSNYWRNVILTMPVKIPSRQVDEVIESVKKPIANSKI